MSLEGRQIGRFELVAELGRGAMGVVYRGRDPHLGRDVAIKVLAPELASDEEMVTRFTDEARHASRLIHQNIATVFEAGPSPEGWYVAFELVEGMTLKAILAKEGVLNVNLATNYILQTADGLAAAHRGQVVHRDLKPENLIVTPEGIIKITDFGLAKRMGDPGKTRAGTILGTAFYMAPEQAKGMPVDYRADWFSLGVMAYEMISGKRPFDGYHEMAILYAVVNEDPEPLATLRADAPAELIDAVSRLMTKSADNRLCDASELRGLIGSGGASKAETPGSGVSQVAATPSINLPPDASAAPAAPATVDPDAPPILVVLPLENKSPDPEYAYLAEGFAEDIGATLAQCERFMVLEHDRVINSKPESGSADEWAAALGARYILSGSLFRAGDRLKLRLNLRDRSTGKLDWTQAFAGNKDDIFEFQEDVAQQVLESLTGEAPTQSMVARPSTPSNAEAYDLYLKGRDYYRREGRENLEFAMSMFDKALAVDPQYAAAHAAIADAYAQMYLMYYDRDTKWLKKAETSAKTALMIDSSLPEAHRALGRVMMEYGQNEDAIKEFEVAIKKNPEFYEAYRTLAWIYQGMRQYNDSISWGEKSLRIKPMDRETYLLLGLNYLDLRDWDKARHH
ncbi:MAG: protein kinase, partial [candidate division Zixibacteria bacterium]|nr:protein kinase [candidate division Zixibacteria bacterium]